MTLTDISLCIDLVHLAYLLMYGGFDGKPWFWSFLSMVWIYVYMLYCLTENDTGCTFRGITFREVVTLGSLVLLLTHTFCLVPSRF